LCPIANETTAVLPRPTGLSSTLGNNDANNVDENKVDDNVDVVGDVDVDNGGVVDDDKVSPPLHPIAAPRISEQSKARTT
jgi:hypothetical protein